MKAYKNDPTLKSDLIAEMANHRAADAIVKGQYGPDDHLDQSFRGCAVGCAVHSLNIRRGTHMAFGDHAALAAALDIPEHLPRLFDAIFEGLPDTHFADWPGRVLAAMRVSADYSLAHVDFLIAVQERNIARLDASKFSEQIDAIQRVTEVLRNWRTTGTVDQSARSAAAWSARSAARSAAESAARSAESAAAESAAWSAWSAAWSAARSAAESAAWSEYVWMADTLVAILESTK